MACRPAQADANALAVHIATGAGATLKLGYLPREAAAALAPMVRLPRPTLCGDRAPAPRVPSGDGGTTAWGPIPKDL